MAIGAIFRALLRWRDQGALSHLFMGSITCTLRKWILISQLGPMDPRTTQETPWEPASEGQGTAPSSRNPSLRGKAWGSLLLEFPEQIQERQACLQYGEETEQIKEFLASVLQKEFQTPWEDERWVLTLGMERGQPRGSLG